MSLVTKAIGGAKKLKHRFQDKIKEKTPVYMSPVRRIERVSLKDRVVAMTFDDGPCAMTAKPSKSEKPLTLLLAETLEKYEAVGTFDVVGDTSGNYPDKAGCDGSASWGGIKYDHYPDFGCDSLGGVINCPKLTKRILDGGHEITSHTYSHVLFGSKPLVYGNRAPMHGIDEVISDLKKLDLHMKQNYGYEIKLSRPPHYVDKTKDGFSAYDAYAVMGYQYLAASFDGAGWLPLSSYEAEIDAMVRPLERSLETNPDSLCGQIIFQKDGYNMARRSPVADGLERQLELLIKNGYRVVGVSELLELCPFSDLLPDNTLFECAKKLLDRGMCICYRDNTVRANNILTRGELAMILHGSTTATERITLVKNKKNVAKDVSYKHPYAAAITAALEVGEMTLLRDKFYPNAQVTGSDFATAIQKHFGFISEVPVGMITHADAISAIAKMIKK